MNAIFLKIMGKYGQGILKMEKKETEQKNSKEKRSPSNKSYKEDDKKDKLMNNIKMEKKQKNSLIFNGQGKAIHIQIVQ